MSAHRITVDSWGYYCLGCQWPGGDFCHHGNLAQRHAADANGGVR